MTDEQLARMVAMDIATVIHLDGAPDWILHEDVMAEFDKDDPARRPTRLGRWRDFVDAGLHVASATDAPWTFPDSTHGRHGPAGRPDRRRDGRPRSGRVETPPWLLDQLLTAEQGLRAVTADAAYALGDEARRGHLAPGTLGDVTILSGDLTAATPDEIRAMTVVATIVGGTPVYCADPAMCRLDVPPG